MPGRGDADGTARGKQALFDAVVARPGFALALRGELTMSSVISRY